jgi:hypothetical protein
MIVYNINEFKEVANKVPNYKSLPDEGKYRTAIGRYYYFIFLKLREIVKDVEKDRENGIISYLDRGMAHAVLPIYFELFSNNIRSRKLKEDLNNISDSLRALRKLRNKCDYNIYSTITPYKVREAEDELNTIEDIISNITYKNQKNDIEIIGLKDILNHFKENLPSSDDVLNKMYSR